MDIFSAQRPDGVNTRLNDPVILKQMATALPLIVRMLDEWQINLEDQVALVGIDISTLERSRQGKVIRLDQEQVTRLSLIAGIYQALHRVFPEASANAWFTKPRAEPPYDGRSPLRYTHAAGIPGLFETRRLLDAVAIGNFATTETDRREASRIRQPDFEFSADI